MPLFKLIIPTINQNKKCENIFRWFVKDSMNDITYEQLNERIQSIFYKLDTYNNSNDLMKEFQVLWYDGEDLCRIISTEDLHDAIHTLGGLNGNEKSIRFYITSNDCEQFKNQLNEKNSNELQLPDLPETLDKLEIDENVQHSNTDLNHIETKSNKKQSIIDKSIVFDQKSNDDIDLDHQSVLPSAPTLMDSTTMDLLWSSLQLPQYNMNYMNIPQNVHAYTTYTPYTQGYYLYNKMNISKLPLPSSLSSSSLSLSPSPSPSPSSSLSLSTYLQSYPMNNRKKLTTTNTYNTILQIPNSSFHLNKRNNPYTRSCINLATKSNIITNNNNNNKNNDKHQIDISAIIIRLRHMGFQQSDIYLSNIIKQYNGNINPILDRLSFENNKK
ncbi:unnamed protein product [Schistosoma margrebowiei]|uniref:Uncharacterized protein n=1 Tax=Schistosoma margrebowiei TaxID=48269 RepID=A0AA85AJL4_9TREM|nr:unnamed protein product [Schistosoma margrebowiei]